MSTSASSKRQVLAKFIDEVPLNKGWWFCLPTISSSQLSHPTDCYMPHLGVQFRMTKVAIVKILLSMECLRFLRGKPHMNIQGSFSTSPKPKQSDIDRLFDGAIEPSNQAYFKVFLNCSSEELI
jgi:hypothetical protein